jgi:hypothetical protein
LIYAENIYSTLKNALFTSANIDEELLFEKSILSRDFEERDQYPTLIKATRKGQGASDV